MTLSAALAEVLAELDVVACREFELRRITPPPHLGVVVFAVAGRHIISQQVGQPELDIAQLDLDLLQCPLAGLEPIAEILYGREQRLDILTIGFGLADAFRARVSFALQPLRFDLQ